MKTLSIIICILGLTFLVGWRVNTDASVSQKQASSRILAAVVRADGVLVPFATYAKGKWSNSWPTSEPSREENYNSMFDLASPW
ncbi:MAG: hypothetical protein ACRD63_07265, partial [Pyrinomonadaceae bacterium]